MYKDHIEYMLYAKCNCFVASNLIVDASTPGETDTLINSNNITEKVCCISQSIMCKREPTFL